MAKVRYTVTMASTMKVCSIKTKKTVKDLKFSPTKIYIMETGCWGWPKVRALQNIKMELNILENFIKITIMGKAHGLIQIKVNMKEASKWD